LDPILNLILDGFILLLGKLLLRKLLLGKLLLRKLLLG